jgi:hypothetical protein
MATDVAAKKHTSPKRKKIEVVADAAWADRVLLHARRLGLNLSAFVRMALTQRMDADDAARKGGG